MSARRTDRKPARKAEALARNAAWDALPRLTKIDHLHSRPGVSKRQRDRLMADTTTRIKAKIAARARAAQVTS